MTSLNVEVGPKRLELLHELIPAATVVALLVNPTNPPLAETLASDLQAAARSLGLQLHVLQARTESDFDMVFANLVKLRVDGLVIGSDIFFVSRIEQLAALTVRHAVPAIFQYREFAASGGLMSYGGSLAIFSVRSAPTPAAFSRARSRPTSRSNSLRRWSFSST